MAAVSDQDIVSLTLSGSAPAPQAGPALAQPADYTGLISSTEQKYSLPQGLLGAIITKGERSGASAVSRKGAVGVGQLMPGTARDMGVTDPTDPAQNIDGAGRYLGQMLQRYGGDHTLAVAAYNAGPGAVDQHGGVPPYPETQAYVTRVLGQPAAQQGAGQSTGGDDIVSMTLGGKNPSLSAPSEGAAPPPTPTRPSVPTANSIAQMPDASPRASNDIVNANTGASYNPAQVKTLQQMAAAGMLDLSQGAFTTKAGTKTLPYVQTDPGVIPNGQGVYYVDLDGKLQQTAGDEVKPVEGLQQGGIQGLRDVKNSIANIDDVNPAFEAMLAKTNPGAAKNLARQAENHGQQAVENKLYDARYGGNGYALGGRIVGNIAGSAPIMALAPEASAISDADAVGNVVGQIGRFAAGGAGKTGAGVGNLLVRGGSLAARGAGEGAAAAALTSSASDTPLQDQVAAGALAGAVLSPAAKVIGGVAKSAGSAASEFGSSVNRLFGAPESKVFTPAEKAQAQEDALNYVNRLVQRAPAGSLDSPVEAAGKPITAAEALGRRGQTQLAVMARRSGDAGDVVESFMRQRQQAMPQRVLSDMASATGLDPAAISGDFAAHASDLRTAASPLYDKAYAAGGVGSQTLDALTSRPAMQAAMQRAMSIAAEEGRSPSELGFVVQNTPNAPTTEMRTVTQAVPGGGTRDVQVKVPVTGGSTPEMVQVQNPTAQTWDYVKRGLDDVINANRNPVTGKLILDEKGRAQLGTLNALRSELVKLNPAYGDALAAGGEPLRLEDAYRNAPKLMADNVPLNTFSAKFSALSPSEQQAHVGGFVNNLYERIEAGKLRLKDMQSPLFQKKMTIMLGPEKASAVTESLGHEAALMRTGSKINPNGGSPTAELTAADKDQEATMRTVAGAAGKVAKGDFLGAAAHALTDPFLGAVRGAQVPLNEASRTEAANLLMLAPSELKNRLVSLGNAQNPNFGYRGVIARQLVPASVITGNRLIGNAQ